MSLVNAARLLLVCIVALLVQVTVLDQVVVAGYHADVMVLLPVAAGLVGGAQRGAVTGFVAGLLADLVLPTPYGLSALTFVLLGFAAGMLRRPSGETLFGRGLLCLLGGAVGTLGFAVLGALIGQPGMLGGSTAEAVVAVALGGLVLVWLALAATSWAFVALSGTGERHSMPSGGSATL